MATTLDEIYAKATLLTAEDRLRLVDKLARDLALTSKTAAPSKRYDWMSIRGIAPQLLGGEDAQEWVSRTRLESDEQRVKTLKREVAWKEWNARPAEPGGAR